MHVNVFTFAIICNVFINMSQEIEEFMKIKKGLIPNVDFYSATVYHSLGIDSDTVAVPHPAVPVGIETKIAVALIPSGMQWNQYQGSLSRF